MDWGLKNRLARFIRPDGKTVMLAVDHGYFQGPVSGIENASATISPLLEYADALMPTRGVLRTSVSAMTDTPIILRVSGGTSLAADDLSNEGIMTSMKDAVRLNVCGVALSVFVGSAHERESLLNLGRLVDDGHKYGMPVLAVTAVGRDMARDAKYLGMACRIAAEIGACVVKTYYCETDFDKVVNGCPVPVVIAGGRQMDTEMDAFEMTYNAIQNGAVGVDMGRNIWKNTHPVAMIKAVRAIVHDGFTPSDAQSLYESLKNEKVKS